MAETMNRRIILAQRPTGVPTDDDLRLVEEAAPEPGAGQVLVRTIYMSLDPYMRGRMDAAKSYAEPVEIGAVMGAGIVGQVAASNDDRFAKGDFVFAMGGWQDYSLLAGDELRKLDPAQAPISTALGVLGMPGLTAYVGLIDKGRPQADETVVISAASGAVGSVAGQIARIKGCRVVGIAGGADKCAYLTDELGFDAAIDRRAPDFEERLATACPDGIDVYFENVGGPVFDAVIKLLNVGARIPVCGLIAYYNATELPLGPNQVPRLMRAVLVKRLTLGGFIVSDHFDRFPDFARDVGGWIADGKLRYREDVVDGLENARDAFRGLLEGRNFGKLLVRVSPDTSR